MVSRSIEEVRSSIAAGLKVCLVSGKFNVVHPGHLRLFRHAKELCDHLVVGIYSDQWSPGLLLPAADRLEGVRSNIWVDDAFILEDEIDRVILSLKPDVVLKGKEHEFLENLEKAAVEQYGGTLSFAGGRLGLSGFALLYAEEGSEYHAIRHDEGYLNRHGISSSDLAAEIETMCSIRTLVLGDVIVDRYTDCEPVGMSAEDPTIVVSPVATRQFVGGAGIVASHAGQIGASTSLVSICGEDEAGEFAVSKLIADGVDTQISVDPHRPTTLKTRFRAGNKSLLRVNDFRDHQIASDLSEKAYSEICKRLSEVDLVIFSDFSYGFLTEPLIKKVMTVCEEADLVIAGDSQSSSQIVDVTKFQNVALLTPTEREARLALRDNTSGLVGLSQALMSLTKAKYTPITLGSDGVFLHIESSESRLSEDDQVLALNKNPIDVSGAGDAFLVSTSMSLAAGSNIWSAIYIGSIAAACQVARVGNLPLTRDDLLGALPS